MLVPAQVHEVEGAGDCAGDAHSAAQEMPPAKRNLWVAAASATDVRVQRERLEQLVAAPEDERAHQHHHAGFSGRTGTLVGFHLSPALACCHPCMPSGTHPCMRSGITSS